MKEEGGCKLPERPQRDFVREWREYHCLLVSSEKKKGKEIKRLFPGLEKISLHYYDTYSSDIWLTIIANVIMTMTEVI